MHPEKVSTSVVCVIDVLILDALLPSSRHVYIKAKSLQCTFAIVHLCAFQSAAAVFAHSNSFCLHTLERTSLQTLEKLVTLISVIDRFRLTDQLRLCTLCTLPLSHLLISTV